MNLHCIPAYCWTRIASMDLYRVRQNKRPQCKNCSILNGAMILNENFLVHEDIIWHKRPKFYKVTLLHAKMVRVWFQRTLFLSEIVAVFFYQSKSCLQILKTTEYKLTEYQLNDVTITSFCLVNKSTAEGHPGTEFSACEDLGRVATRRYLQVDREFQEASASLCKCRWRTFWAFTVTLLIDLTYVCYFCNKKAKRCKKMWSLLFGAHSC